MKQKQIKVSLPSRELEFKLNAPEPQTIDEYVGLCGGKEDAAISCGMSGWYVKAQSHVRGVVEENQTSEEKGVPVKGPALGALAQKALDGFAYTGPKARAKKAKVKVSKAALKEQGLSATELKGMDKLLAILASQGVEIEE